MIRALESRRKRSYMVKDPVAEFWKNADCLLDEVTFRHSIARLLAAFRETLEDDTATAEAIDAQKSMRDIAISAEDDGYAEFAQILRMVP